jgi:hypothetical protein
MSGLELLVGIAGFIVTVLVVAAMILITPRNQVALHAPATDPQGSSLSTEGAAQQPDRGAVSAGR